MAIREDLVASAAQFLQDPTVAASPIEKRIAFLQAKNLTQEEVSAALARVGTDAAVPSQAVTSAAPSPVAQPQPQPYYGQQHPPQPQYPPYAWQQPPPEVPRRDWRDWFIMATVVGGVSYGLYTLGKRYIYPLVAPPTPERLEQDKKSIDDQFEKAFALIEQLAKDTEALKTAELQRTEKLDTAITELQTVMRDLKSGKRRRDDEAQRVRDDVQSLRDAIPKAMNAQKEANDTRFRDFNSELKSLKTLLAQRLEQSRAAEDSTSNSVRPSASVGNMRPMNTASVNGTPAATTPAATEEPKQPDYNSLSSGLGRSTPLANSSGMPASKPAIPAWQLALQNGGSSPSSATNGAGASASS
ncbi:peroxisomal membrane protein PER10 [Diplogelasinospora grovesii]|uniref:Peroxisomal membrane protein PEX14 n=1 Tax=Diplogelasinospora grovesii TaxID=303347 RepID=A0AAN6N9E0_9PEZI|nr:peroxisomal membrane protein PER10 [Diplogelasinospora grovesii]